MTVSDPTHTNRLAREKSPYLLQHAHNPVDWYPWGAEAFEKARREEKPIFLSVGYSTCHWCHVMAHESFENEAIASVLNAHFVAIKVDREERPDIDRVYMTYVQATTGAGGWPMSVWLTPDLKPFVGGTYYPPEDCRGRPGFQNVLLQIAAAWRKDRNAIITAANDVTRQLQQATAGRAEAGTAPAAAFLETGYQQIKASYDPRYGGFGGAPKFPRPVTLNFLLRHYARTGTAEALDMSLFTLRKMADGGIHDHLGGGFHRYSVDEVWLVPHFEKMLYDQAQLACSYVDAWQVTHEPFYADVARDTLEYVLRDLTGPDGQFYSAEDADSPRPGAPAILAEGAFYVWEQSEVVVALGEETAAVFNYHYGVEPGGNVPSDPRDEFRNQNILVVRHPLAETGRKFGQSADAVRDLLAAARLKMLELRTRRSRPRLDDKTLTAWNGLMISAFARAAQVLEEPRYLAAAQRAAGFVETRLFDPNRGRLLRRHCQGETAIDGFADDYAYFIQGLLDLYEASLDVKWLKWALDLQKRQDALFWDKNTGGYFSTTGTDPSILLRLKDDDDGAEPSPNAVAAMNLLRQAQLTGNQNLCEQAETIFAASGRHLRRVPSAMPQMLVAVAFHLAPPRQTVIEGKAAADVCENYACQLPTTDVATLARRLKNQK